MDKGSEVIYFRDLLTSEGWKLFKQQADTLIRGAHERLKTNKFESLADVARLQGEIAVIERLMAYPQSVLEKSTRK